MLHLTQRCPFPWAFIPLSSELLVWGQDPSHLCCCLTDLGPGGVSVCKPLREIHVGLAEADAEQVVLLLYPRC